MENKLIELAKSVGFNNAEFINVKDAFYFFLSFTTNQKQH
jgi:hypothetical protein